MKIIIDNKIPFIAGRLEEVADVVYTDPFSFTPELVKDADALIIRTRTRCDSRLLEGSKVSLVATATIGTDQIDLPWCRKRGITVRNAAGCNAPGVAQYVWSALLRDGFDPASQTLGVVGYGNIGTIVADWGRKLGCRILVCDPPRRKAGFNDVEYLPLESVLREADAVTLHTPLTKSGEDATYHLIGERELEMMRPGSTLINAARGGVVDNIAWQNHLAGRRGCQAANGAAASGTGAHKAVIDVWEGEPDINRNLLDLALVATPHIAGYSFEGKQRATRMVLEAVEQHFGVRVNKDGLTGQYVAPEAIASADIITSSYDPAADTAALRGNPGEFEQLRSNYNYRHEPFLKI